MERQTRVAITDNGSLIDEEALGSIAGTLSQSESGKMQITIDKPRLRDYDTIPREGEKEKIKRLLYSLIDRIEKL